MANNDGQKVIVPAATIFAAGAGGVLSPIARVQDAPVGPWNLTLGPLQKQGGKQDAADNFFLLSQVPAVGPPVGFQGFSRAEVRWGTKKLGYEAVLDWYVGASLTVWGEYVEVSWRIAADNNNVPPPYGNQAYAVGAAVVPGNGPGHASHRRPTFTQWDPGLGAGAGVTPVPRWARWMWPQFTTGGQADFTFLDEAANVIAFYQVTGFGQHNYLTPIPVPHYAQSLQVGAVMGGNLLAAQYELELG